MEKHQAKLLDDKDKEISKLAKELKTAKDRNIAILKEGKVKRKINPV